MMEINLEFIGLYMRFYGCEILLIESYVVIRCWDLWVTVFHIG